MRLVWLAIWLGCFGVALAGCGGDKKGGPAAPAAECSPGTSFTCVGRNGCPGRQLCNINSTWAECACTTSSPSGAGSSGGAVAGAGAGAPDGGSTGPSTRPPRGGGGDGGTPPDPNPPPNSGDEICDNGIDDDGDGAADCADNDCSDRTCARQAPDGWQGPAVLFAGAPPEACPAAYADELAHGGTAPAADPALCDACTCTPASPACASFLDFSVSATSGCGGVTCSASVSASCSALSSPCLDSQSTGYVETKVPSGLSGCTPSGQSAELPEATWDGAMLACGTGTLLRGGCGQNRVCAPALPKGAALCIVRSGDQACPAGPYSERQVYFTGIDDSRDCSACACDHDCGYQWEIYDAADTSCASPLLTLNDAEQCVQVTPTSGTIRVGVDITGSGACTPSGGASTGDVTARDPVTVCCDPP